MDSDFIKPIKSFEDIELDMEAPKLSETPRNMERESPLQGNQNSGGQQPQLVQQPETQPQPQTPLQTDNTNKNFKGQQKNEIVLSFTRKHWIVLLPSFLGFAAIICIIVGFPLLTGASALGTVFSPFAYRITALLGLIILTYAFHRFFANLFNYFLQVVIITNFRIVKLEHTLFFSRQGDSIDLNQVQDVVLQRNGIIKTILNYGELTITLATAHATKVLECLPNPEYFFRKINKTKREYITQRRVEKGVNPIPG